jgi:hypothetical protein
MSIETFKIKQALKYSFKPDVVQGTRLIILLSCFLSALIGFFGLHYSMSALAAQKISLLIKHHSLVSLPFSDRLTYYFTMILVSSICVPLTAGIIYVAVKKQRGDNFSISDIFLGFYRFSDFFLLAVFDATFYCLFYCGPFNLLGICPQNPIIFNLFSTIALVLRTFFFAFYFIIPLLLLDQNKRLIPAIRQSIHLMSQSWNFIKFSVCHIAICLVVIGILALTFFSSLMLNSVLVNPFLHLFYTVLFVGSIGLFVYFLPMAFQFLAAIYRILTTKKVTI